MFGIVLLETLHGHITGLHKCSPYVVHVTLTVRGYGAYDCIIWHIGRNNFAINMIRSCWQNVPYLPRNFANLLEIMSIVVVLSMHKTPAYESENRSKNYCMICLLHSSSFSIERWSLTPFTSYIKSPT